MCSPWHWTGKLKVAISIQPSHSDKFPVGQDEAVSGLMLPHVKVDLRQTLAKVVMWTVSRGFFIIPEDHCAEVLMRPGTRLGLTVSGMAAEKTARVGVKRLGVRANDPTSNWTVVR